MSKSMRVRVLTLLLILGYGEVKASAHGDGDSARATNYTPVSAPLASKKWFTFSPLLKSSTAAQTEEIGNKQYKRWTGLKYSGYIRSFAWNNQRTLCSFRCIVLFFGIINV